MRQAGDLVADGLIEVETLASIRGSLRANSPAPRPGRQASPRPATLTTGTRRATQNSARMRAWQLPTGPGPRREFVAQKKQKHNKFRSRSLELECRNAFPKLHPLLWNSKVLGV